MVARLQAMQAAERETSAQELQRLRLQSHVGLPDLRTQAPVYA